MNIKIFSWNVNGLRSIERKKALTWIDRHQPDILCLQETKLSSYEDNYNLFKKEYFSVTVNNSIKKGFSGTITFTDFKATKDSFCHEIDTEFDGRIIKQHFKNIVLLNIYVPNGKLNQNRLEIKIKFLENLFLYCENLKKENFSIIICGDFNIAHQDIDLKKSKIYNNKGFSKQERACLDKFIHNGYIDSYRHMHGNKTEAYTLFPYRSKAREKNEGWRVDYILLSSDLKENLKDSFILSNILGSDHSPIGITLVI